MSVSATKSSKKKRHRKKNKGKEKEDKKTEALMALEGNMKLNKMKKIEQKKLKKEKSRRGKWLIVQHILIMVVQAEECRVIIAMSRTSDS